jgi:hypothetical protein
VVSIDRLTIVSGENRHSEKNRLSPKGFLLKRLMDDGKAWKANKITAFQNLSFV